MFSSGDIGHRLEPMRIVGGAVFHSPITHGSSHSSCDCTVEFGTHALCQFQTFIHIAGQSLGHYSITEYFDAIGFGNIHTLSSFLLEK